MSSAHVTRSAFHAGQFVIVRVSSQKTEIGQIESLDDTRATICTRSGFTLSRGISALVPAWLIVLDLNGVLGFRKSSKEFQMRPYVEELLGFLFRNFVVGIWTSCLEPNGTRIIKEVFGESANRLIFRMYRDECTPNPTPENRFGTFKDLRRVWDRFPHFHAANTIMVDDSEDKCSHRHNALCPTPYTGGDGVKDEGLREIITVLQDVLAANNLEPIRRHMLARWETDHMSRQTTSATPPTEGVPLSASPSNPRYDLPPTGPFATFACSPPSHQPSRRVEMRRATRQLAKQDAYDSEEERPSVGNTPVASLAATFGSLSTSGPVGLRLVTPPSAGLSATAGMVPSPLAMRPYDPRELSPPPHSASPPVGKVGSPVSNHPTYADPPTNGGNAVVNSIAERMRAIALASGRGGGLSIKPRGGARGGK
jgi:hypothetical protein